MSFGYNSGTMFSQSITAIEDAADELLIRLENERTTGAEKDRPIMFIAHSLGGVIVKKVSTTGSLHF